MGFDPDFVITINGEDVTKYVRNWRLMDTEDGISTLAVKLMNPDQVLSEKFDTAGTITIIFGYVGNMGESIEMKVEEVSESYSSYEDLDFIEVIGMDCMIGLCGSSEQAGGGEPTTEAPQDLRNGGVGDVGAPF